jgi:hypothetical protein
VHSLRNSGEEFLCLNCNQYVRKPEVDEHSMRHLKTT